jgi:hypothetical protein
MKAATIELISRALNMAGTPFIVVGGLAVVAHGYGRTTQDVDLVIRLQPDSIRGAFAARASLGYRPTVPVTADGFADPGQRSRWVTEKRVTLLNFSSDRFPDTSVDLFASEPFDFRTEYDAALVREIAPGVPLRIVRLPTLLRLKREAGRPQDLADIAELRLLHGDDTDA